MVGATRNFIDTKFQFYLGEGECNCFSLPNGAHPLSRHLTGGGGGQTGMLVGNFEFNP